MGFTYEKKTAAAGPFIEITGYEGEAPSLTVPDEIEGLPVRSIGNHALADRSDVREITLPRTLKTLHLFAFQNDANLEKIRVFDAGRDDRVIELLKVFFQNRIMSEQPQLGDVELYYADDEGKDVFVVIGMEGPLGSLEIPEELYQETVDNFGGQMADLRARQDLIVDEKWAMEVIKAVSVPGNRS